MAIPRAPLFSNDVGTALSRPDAAVRPLAPTTTPIRRPLRWT